jgi:hypothetical protein
MTTDFTRFFIPAVSLRVPPAELFNLDGQGIYMEWEINRDNTSNADEGTVRVHNLSPALSGQIFEAWQNLFPSVGFLATFSIGWDGVARKVIVGDVWDIIENERTTTDDVMVFRIGDGNNALRDESSSKMMNGTGIDTALRFLITLPPDSTDIAGGGLGLEYPAESRALVVQAASRLPIQRWRNVPTGMNTRQNVNFLMETIGLEWRVHNCQFIAMRGGVVNRPGPILRPNNGLIRYEKRNDGGIDFEALANPDVEPGLQVQVQDNLEQPFGAVVYRTERIQFRGNSRGDSLMFGEAAKSEVL